MKNKIEIPTSFQLMGQAVTVTERNDLNYDEGAWGRASWRRLSIEMQTEVAGSPLPESVREHTFLHELVHMILLAMNEGELNENEKFVDIFSGLLHQALGTAEYSGAQEKPVQNEMLHEAKTHLIKEYIAGRPKGMSDAELLEKIAKVVQTI